MKDNFWKIIFWVGVLVAFLLWKAYHWILATFGNLFVFAVFVVAMLVVLGQVIIEYDNWKEKNQRGGNKKPPSNNSGTYNG